MADLHTCHNLFFDGKDEFAGASTEKNSIPAVFRATTFALAQVSAFILASIPLERHTDKNLQKATKLALKLFVKG